MKNTKLKEKNHETKTPQTFYQPVLKGSPPPALARATWWPFSGDLCRTGTKGGDL